jgi:hypothetical protein
VTRDFRGNEVVKLVDFGIAKLIDGEAGHEQLTRAGMVFGTPRYMSPEQASGGKLDERTDLYATGLILYQMLAGHPPFVSDDAALLLRMHILADPPALPPSVPEPLARVVAKLLEKSRNDRHASAREVIDELTQLRPALVAASGPGPASMQTHVEYAEASAGASAWQPITTPTSPTAYEPNAATHEHGAPQTSELGHTGHAGHPGGALITTYEPMPLPRVPAKKPARPWLPWVIGAGAIMVALMAFGAGQALQSKNSPSTSSSAPDDHVTAPGAKPSASSSAEGATRPTIAKIPTTIDDRDCSDRVCGCDGVDNCELGCERGCTVHCTDVDRCEITVGDDSSVSCDNVGKCEVDCLGDCEVHCPQGGCEVKCSAPTERAGKSGKQKRKKPKRCGDIYLCGRDCDDDDD